MKKRFADRLLQTLMDWVGDLDVQPQEIVLEERAYINTAFECGVHDSAGKTYYAVEPFYYLELDPMEPLPSLRMVKVGASFIIQGPAGPCTVRLKS